MSLDGKVILVTGGASGIGKATVERLALDGAHVIVADVQTELAAQVVADVSGNGGNAEACALDVTDHAAASAAVAAIAASHGRLDGAFNNAGIEGPSAKVLDVDPSAWARVLAVNLTGVFNCVQAELGQMVNQDTGGCIVNTASIAGVVGLPGAAAYNSAKHGVVGLTKTVALEYASRNVRVNAVCPGLIDTPMFGRVTDASVKNRDKMMGGVPMRRVASPNEIADVVAWLMSAQSSYVTGVAIPVDGGWTAQ
jgi:NAD(P)-dependent dehydrogenase (short-subunit alcohol dehydrogenase family)